MSTSIAENIPDLDRKRPKSAKQIIGRIALYTTMLTLAAFVLMPLLVIVLNSLRLNEDILRESFIGWPTQITFDN
jgi:glucose/mannose transport system permease protein